MAASENPRFGVLASGGASTFDAVAASYELGEIESQPVVGVSNNSDSGLFAICDRIEIPAFHISNVTHPGEVPFPGAHTIEAAEAIADIGREFEVDAWVGLGYMKRVLRPVLMQGVLNEHPGKLPETAGLMLDGAIRKALELKLPKTGPTLHWMGVPESDEDEPFYDDESNIVGHLGLVIYDYDRLIYEEDGTIEPFKDHLLAHEKMFVPGWIDRALLDLKGVEK